MREIFKTKNQDLKLPIFFPDATQGVIKGLDSNDIRNTKTEGVLVNTYHLYRKLGKGVLNKFGGVGEFMNWEGGLISDSGGFQLMSLVKKTGKGRVRERGIEFISQSGKVLFTPEESISFQMEIGADMLVVLDDFTPPKADYNEAKKTVERTIRWAKRSKDEFEKICDKKGLSDKERPYLLGVVQGGEFLDLRKDCANRLEEIGFDGFGFGGWPVKESGDFHWEVAECLAENTPEDYFLYGLGIGMPDDIVGCVDLGYNIFDCVLPTRDGRHGRIYRYKAGSMEEIKLEGDFYEFLQVGKERQVDMTEPVSRVCDCVLCENYSLGYLAHLFRINEMTAGRLASIHNLRFYSILMEKLKDRQ